MSLAKFFEKLGDLVKQRVESPFLSAFFVSWIIFNYKIILVFFGSGDYEKKIKYIDKELYAFCEYTPVSYQLWMPTGVALAYVCFYPFLDILFSVISNSFDNLKKFFLLWIERKQPVPKDEKIVYFSDFDKQIDEQKSKVKELNDLFTASRTRSAEDVKRIELENNKNQERFKVQVAWRITAECGGGVPLFEYLMRAPDVMNPQPQPV